MIEPGSHRSEHIWLPAQQKAQPLNQNNLPHNAPTATQIPAPAPGAKLASEISSIPRPSNTSQKAPSLLDEIAGVGQNPNETWGQRMHRLEIRPEDTVRGGYKPVKHPTTGEESGYKGITDESINQWEQNQTAAKDWDEKYKGKGGRNPHRAHSHYYGLAGTSPKFQIERCLKKTNHPKRSCGDYCQRYKGHGQTAVVNY